jgi:hypothetical protein
MFVIIIYGDYVNKILRISDLYYYYYYYYLFYIYQIYCKGLNCECKTTGVSQRTESTRQGGGHESTLLESIY